MKTLTEFVIEVQKAQRHLNGDYITIWSARTVTGKSFILAYDPEQPGNWWLLREQPKVCKYEYDAPSEANRYQSREDALDVATTESA